MKGMVFVGPEGIGTKENLRAWVRRGVKFAGSMPAKEGSLLRADQLFQVCRLGRARLRGLEETGGRDRVHATAAVQSSMDDLSWPQQWSWPSLRALTMVSLPAIRSSKLSPMSERPETFPSTVQTRSWAIS